MTDTDDLHRRLSQADPAPSTGLQQLSETSIRDLMEAAMQNTTTQKTPRPSRWLLAAAAAIVLVLGGVVGARMLSDDPAPSATPESAAMKLTLPDAGAMSSCLPYTVDVLAQMPTAFSGEVLEAEGGTVVLEVDNWYRGGDAESVELVSQTSELTSIDDVEFVEGGRYLVTASETGTVSTCGYTGEWSASMAADFEQAFGR